MKRNEVLMHATERINLKIIMSSERNKSQKNTFYIFHMYEISRIIML
jgi:hypothetical protein